MRNAKVIFGTDAVCNCRTWPKRLLQTLAGIRAEIAARIRPFLSWLSIKDNDGGITAVNHQSKVML